MTRILLLGGSGILGSEVHRRLESSDFDHVAPKSSDLDVRDKDSLRGFSNDFKPNWIINCTAWTDVDGAEENFAAALDLNESAVQYIASVANQVNSHVIHISTDYVFDGTSSKPYDENSIVSPINNYGESKLRGERVLLNTLPARGYVIRTSWLYGTRGKNFVKTMAIKSTRGEPAKVVIDQVGSPTSARDLANAIYSVIEKHPPSGIYNYSNKGSCSWYDLARLIYKTVGANPELVEAIATSSLSAKARRPRYSLLSKDKWDASNLTKIPEWEISLKSMLSEMIPTLRTSEQL
jgi:dTDP-4-dehydrorhamnose reductase